MMGQIPEDLCVMLVEKVGFKEAGNGFVSERAVTKDKLLIETLEKLSAQFGIRFEPLIIVLINCLCHALDYRQIEQRVEILLEETFGQ